jgi:predicted transcriptional regulator
VLLPIQPQYATPIIEGRKRAEFRKTIFRTPPSRVVVYASSPVKSVVGYFDVSRIDVAPVGLLWERYSEVGCIDEDDFVAYYGDREHGVVLCVGDVVVLDEPMSLEDLGLDGRPPKSFMYVEPKIIGLLDEVPSRTASAVVDRVRCTA